MGGAGEDEDGVDVAGLIGLGDMTEATEEAGEGTGGPCGLGWPL